MIRRNIKLQLIAKKEPAGGKVLEVCPICLEKVEYEPPVHYYNISMRMPYCGYLSGAIHEGTCMDTSIEVTPMQFEYLVNKAIGVAEGRYTKHNYPLV